MEVITKNYSEEKRYETDDFDKSYEKALSLVPNMNYSLDDILLLMKEGSLPTWSVYPSALINKVIKPEDKLILNFNYEDFKNNNYITHRDNIGIFLPHGTIIINSNYKGILGYKMKGGEIIVKGSCKGGIGTEMYDGKIKVRGDLDLIHAPKNMPGQEMKGGTLEVMGNAIIGESTGGGEGIGFRIEGGEIIVHGNAGIVGSYMKGGKITIKGDTKNNIGNMMEDGEIYIESSSYGVVGWRLKGGRIIVKRECKSSVGQEMYGGEIEVIGDVSGDGSNVGWCMYGGKIIVRGNIKSSRSSIGSGNEGGEIIVYGDALHSNIGSGMREGFINIKGSVGLRVGDVMEGGTIEIDGYMPPDKSYKFTEKPIRYGGSVYNRGKLVKENIATKIGKWLDKKR